MPYKPFRYSCCLLVITLLFSCHRDPAHNLFGKWTVSTAMKDDQFADAMEVARQMFSVSEGTHIYEADSDFFKLYSDHTFTALSFGRYFLYGSWQTDENQSKIILKCKGSSKGAVHNTIVLQIIKKQKDDMIIRTQTHYNIYKDRFFEADSLHLAKVWKPMKNDVRVNTFGLKKTNSDADQDKDDVWSLANNRWRIKPVKPENFDEIKQRVMGSIKFAINYFNLYTDNNGLLLTPIILPVSIAPNGMEMQYPNEVDTTWKDLFYDDSEALIGYRIIETAMKREYLYKGSTKMGAMQIGLLKLLQENIIAHAGVDAVMLPN